MRVQLGIPPSIVPIFWGLFFLEATFGAYLSVWPLWIERLGAPITIVGLVLGSSGFIRLLVIGPSAAIADRLGYRRAILICRMFTVVGLLSASIATHWSHLIVMLVGGAIGELVFPLLQVLVASLSGDQRMRSFALVFTVGPSIALIASPLISGLLVWLFGIRAAFVFGAACSTLSLFYLARIKEPEGFSQRSAIKGSTYRDAMADPGVRLVASLLLVTVFTLSLGTAFIPTFLEDVRGMNPAVISIIGSGAAVGSACFGIAVARILRLQRAPFHAVALAISVIGVGFVLFRSTGHLPLLAIAFFSRGGLFSAWAMLSAALGELAPFAHRARAFAITEMTGGLAYAMGPILAGPLYARSNRLAFDVAIVLCVLLLPVMFVAQRKAVKLRRPAEELSAPILEPDPGLAV